MDIIPTPLQGLKIIETTTYRDNRGSFTRLFCDQELDSIIGPRKIKQINQSTTLKVGTVRGLHFQYPPDAEMKLVRCTQGCIWDVAVDLRQGSPSFLQWHAEELSHDNMRMMIIPEGFAHGFQALTNDIELLYLHTAHYTSITEGGINPLDPLLEIHWPLKITELSARDSGQKLIDIGFQGIVL